MDVARPLRAALPLAALFAAGALGAPAAQAAATTIGVPTGSLVTGTANFTCSAMACTYGQFNTNTSTIDPAFVAPSGGVIVRWRLGSGSSGNPITLRVIRGTGGSNFTGAGTGTTRTTAGGVTTYEDEHLPIAAGDTIGLNDANNQLVMATAPASEIIGGWSSPVLADGAPGRTVTNSASSLLLQLNADIERDSDGDTFGDETQDQCPTDGSTHGSCPVPTISGTPQVSRALTATPGGAPANPSYQWLRCDASGNNCAPISGATSTTYVAAPLDQGHRLRFRKTANNASATQTTDSAPTAVVAAGPPLPPGTVPPVLSAASMLRTKFAVASFATPVAARRKAPRGSAFRYTLSTAAAVKITILAQLPGRRSGRRCAAPTRALSHKRRCTRLVSKGTLTRTQAAGPNTVPFSGRIGRRALKLGRYRAVISAADAGGSSPVRTLSFTIVKR